MTTKEPIVSVIIPTYNRVRTIGRSVRSVLNQTFSNFELIVVDDGSTDNTEEVIKGFEDSRIVYIRHERNRGGSAARNTGINAARGEYIAFNDSDDEWLPTKLERQMELFKQDKKGDLGLVLCEILVMGPRGASHIVPRIKLMTYENLLSHRTDLGYFTPQFLVKRTLAGTGLYFDEDISAAEDWGLLFRLARVCRIDYVPEVLARVHTNSLGRVTNPKNYLKSRLAILVKYGDELKAHPRALRICYYDLAWGYYRAGEPMSQVRHYLKAAITIYPAHPTAYIALAFSILGKPSLWVFIKLFKALPTRLKRAVSIS